MKKFFHLLYLYLMAPYFSLKFPPNFKTCNRRQSGFRECLIEAAEIGVRQLDRPYDEIGLPGLKVILVEDLSLSPSKTVGFRQNYRNLRFYGFTNARFSRFDVNFENPRIVMECKFPEVHLDDFDYEFNGKFLEERDFFGQGHGNITFYNLTFSFIFDLEEYENMSKSFYRLTDSRLSMDTDLIKSYFDNLFHGHEERGIGFNEDINQNWRQIFLDVRPKYEKVFGELFSDIFEMFLEKVSIKEMFGE